MTDDEFSTVNVKRQQIARELDALRQHYLSHREQLAQLERDAPSESLAARYVELQREIDIAIEKLGEIAAGRVRATAPGTAGRRTAEDVTPPLPPLPASAQARTAPGTGPHPRSDWQNVPVAATVDQSAATDEKPDDARRLLLLVVITVLVLALLGYLVWRFTGAGERGTPAEIVEETATTATPETATTPAEPPSTLDATPPSHDFGVVKKGTRAVRQFRIANSGDKPVKVSATRSQCRCLWFDYDNNIAAGSSTIFAVTVDGAKAKSGALAERITISADEDPAQKTVIEIHATIE